MKCVTRPVRSNVWAALALLAAAGLPARSAAAQELQPLPLPAPPAPPAPPTAPFVLQPATAPVVEPAPAVMQPPPAPPSEVRFEPEETDVALFRLGAAVPTGEVPPHPYGSWFALYDPICQGPCSTRLVPGTYRFALSKGGRVVPVRGPIVLDGPATLHGEYVDRSVLRAAGLVIGVAGAVGGFVMVVASAQNGAACDVNGFCISNGTTNVPLLATGVSLLVVSAVVGSVLTFQGDSARITVEPLALPGHASREGALTALAGTPQGAALALHF